MTTKDEAIDWAEELEMLLDAQESGIITAEKWAHVVREATAKRDDAIRRMSAEGSSLRQIASATHLSHSAIAKIIAKG